MGRKSHGQVRRGQVITTYGPGALIDLPKHSAIVGGLETWPKTSDLEEIPELQLARKLQVMTGVTAPRLYAPPPDENDPRESVKGIGAWRFPEWFIVQEAGGSVERERSRRLVHRKELDDRGRFDGRPVVATRFVRACPKGHVDDLDWRRFVHGAQDPCRQRLWLSQGQGGREAAAVAIGAISSGTYVPLQVTKTLISELGEDLLRAYKINERKSIDDLTARWELHIKPFFGHLRAIEVTSQLVASYIDFRQEEDAENGTINRELAAVKRMFSLARQSTPPKINAVPYIAMLKENNVRTGFLESKQHDNLARETGKVGLWMRALFEVGYTYRWRHEGC